MSDKATVADHYAKDGGDLTDAIAVRLRNAGKDPGKLAPADLASIDEFHVRGRKATLELAQQLNLSAASYVLDIGSGLGGPARTLAQTCGCRVTGIDLTPAFCEAATALSGWVGLGDRVDFRQGDATRSKCTGENHQERCGYVPEQARNQIGADSEKHRGHAEDGGE